MSSKDDSQKNQGLRPKTSDLKNISYNFRKKVLKPSDRKFKFFQKCALKI